MRWDQPRTICIQLFLWIIRLTSVQTQQKGHDVRTSKGEQLMTPLWALMPNRFHVTGPQFFIFDLTMDMDLKLLPNSKT